MLKFRPFLNQDLQSICSFPQSEEELFYFYPKALYPLTPEQLQSAIDQRSDSTVFVQNDCIVGFANFYRWKDGICCIGNVVVAPFARGQGVAKFIVETMISLADHRHSASVVQISCFNQNIAGLILYNKLGFKPFDVEEREYIDGKRVALIHMHYQITKTQPQL
ncbi:GNAT family N-acetyltransferase [Desulfobacter vibrioformis]|uniref:GNAT family N-acetyltransferase n=1 Tax=Desulfobacter vibrioformis TaxID=34031 RepID=UPI000555BA9C|nr:GNAT family protein [Desulfobacter vibrioformis]